MSAYFCEGLRIGDRDTLLSLVSAVGMEGTARLPDGGSALLDTARADEPEARRLGVTGVSFVVDGRFAIRGAQPEAVFTQALQRAWGHLPPPGASGSPEASA
jgi:predicted DsbA family dithiol-disulfide isomerase